MTAAPAFDPAELARIPDEILARYDVPGPRYTSYPTAPAWSDDFGPDDHAQALARSAHRGAPLSLYLHVPFCESLCIYCGCSVVITKRRERAEHYVQHVVRELDRLAEACDAGARSTVQLAWGGGTPTYLEPEQIERLMARFRARFPFADDAELGIEVDPRVTTTEHVSAIARAGMNRISMGVQDFEPDVQETIHRVQSFELTRDLIAACRAAGLASVNVDLVYGLPLQTMAGLERTLDRVLELDPDRISAFSYAHVPWLKPAQSAFAEDTLPRGRAKFALFVRMVERLCGAGYVFVGMDHFAKPDNELAVAARSGGLWRNFQGFTTKKGTDLLGLGVTSISSFADAFAQNSKDLAAYGRAQDEGAWATTKGLLLTDDDKLRQAVIQDVMCTYRFDPQHVAARFGVDPAVEFAAAAEALDGFAADGLIEGDLGGGFALTSRGRVFVRNVCMAFDARLPRRDRPVFSRTI